MGDSLCGADFSLLPFLQRIFDSKVELSLAAVNIPKTKAYVELALNLDSFQKTVVSPYWWWW